MTTVDAWPGLVRSARCGPFFDLVRWDDDGPPATEAGWHPMTEFADHPLGLAARVDAARESLDARGFDGGASSSLVVRVAASVAFLGLTARLLSPPLGALLTAGVLPELRWHRLYWRPAAVGVLPLASGPVAGRLLPPADPSSGAGSDPGVGHSAGSGPGAESVSRLILSTTVAPVLQLGDVVAKQFGVPSVVIAGNVASALVGAVQIALGAQPSPDEAGIALVTDLLAAGELADTGTFVGPPAQHRTRFRRRSCCLLYRVHGADLCGDCILHEHPRSGGAGQARLAPAEQQDARRNRHEQQ